MPARARVRCGPREQRERERDRGDELEHFYHKSQQLGSAHSIFSKTPGGAAAISSAKPPSPNRSALPRLVADKERVAQITQQLLASRCVGCVNADHQRRLNLDEAPADRLIESVGQPATGARREIPPSIICGCRRWPSAQAQSEISEPNPYRARNRKFESTSLQRRDAMGRATRRWQLRRCN